MVAPGITSRVLKVYAVPEIEAALSCPPTSAGPTSTNSRATATRPNILEICIGGDYPWLFAPDRCPNRHQPPVVTDSTAQTGRLDSPNRTVRVAPTCSLRDTRRFG